MKLRYRIFGPPPKVFISYSRHDADFAKRLAESLASAEVGVTFDLWEFKVGDSLRQKIDAAVTHSDYIVVVLSPDSVKSKWCQVELSAALMKELSKDSVVLLPALLRKCEIPATISDKIYADFTADYEEGLGFLLDAISQDEGTLDRFQAVRFPEGIPRSIRSHRDGKEMLLVPAGRSYAKEFGRGVAIKEHFYVDADYVTVAEFNRFLGDTNYGVDHAYELVRTFADDPARAPRTRATLKDAWAYAEWAGKRLPTRDEWLRARHVYPAQYDEDRNIWEWTRTEGETYVVDKKEMKNYLLLGGHSFGTPMSSTFTRAVYVPAHSYESFVSFRCCMNVPDTLPGKPT